MYASHGSWLYRIQPSVLHGPFEAVEMARYRSDFDKERVDPNQVGPQHRLARVPPA